MLGRILLALLSFGAIGLARADDAAKVVRVMVLDFRAQGVDEAVAKNVTEAFTAVLAQSPGLSVASAEDVRTLLRASVEQQLLGCDDDKCIKGLGDLLGAQLVVHGSVGKVGETFVINVTKVDVQKGAVAERSSEKAGKIEELLGKATTSAKTISFGASVGAGVPVERLRTHEQAVWAAVQYSKDRRSKLKRAPKVYAASFPPTHFGFDEYDKLAEALPVLRHFSFPGAFPSCFGRDEPSEDAFELKEEKPLLVKAPRAGADALRDAWKDRKLWLDLEFEIAGSKILPLKEFDWKACGEGAKPFNAADIAPTAFIRVRKAVLRDRAHGRQYPVTLQDFDPVTAKVSLSELPVAPVDPEEAPLEEE